MDELNKDTNNELSSLEEQTTVVEPTTGVSPEPSSDETPPASPPSTGSNQAPKPPKIRRWLHWLRGRFNIYLLLFVLLLVFAGAGGAVFYLRANNQNTAGVPSQS